ncbi:MAG: ATP-dependent chaperone ClpB, partial [Pseudomonadota bacterium]
LFRRLGRDQMAGIVRIQLQRLEKLMADRRLTLSIDDGALAWLADKGYDPVYGARPLKRVIQKDLVDPMAKKLLAGELEDGSVIAVSAGADGLEIGRARVH